MRIRRSAAPPAASSELGASIPPLCDVEGHVISNRRSRDFESEGGQYKIKTFDFLRGRGDGE